MSEREPQPRRRDESTDRHGLGAFFESGDASQSRALAEAIITEGRRTAGSSAYYSDMMTSDLARTAAPFLKAHEAVRAVFAAIAKREIGEQNAHGIEEGNAAFMIERGFDEIILGFRFMPGEDHRQDLLETLAAMDDLSIRLHVGTSLELFFGDDPKKMQQGIHEQLVGKSPFWRELAWAMYERKESERAAIEAEDGPDKAVKIQCLKLRYVGNYTAVLALAAASEAKETSFSGTALEHTVPPDPLTPLINRLIEIKEAAAKSPGTGTPCPSVDKYMNFFAAGCRACLEGLPDNGSEELKWVLSAKDGEAIGELAEAWVVAAALGQLRNPEVEERIMTAFAGSKPEFRAKEDQSGKRMYSDLARLYKNLEMAVMSCTQHLMNSGDQPKASAAYYEGCRAVFLVALACRERTYNPAKDSLGDLLQACKK